MKNLKTFLLAITALGLSAKYAASQNASLQDDSQAQRKEMRIQKHEMGRALRDSLTELKDDADEMLNRILENYNSAVEKKNEKKRETALYTMLNFYKAYSSDYDELYKIYMDSVVMYKNKKDKSKKNIVAKLLVDWDIDKSKIVLKVKTPTSNGVLKFNSKKSLDFVYLEKKKSAKSR